MLFKSQKCSITLKFKKVVGVCGRVWNVAFRKVRSKKTTVKNESHNAEKGY